MQGPEESQYRIRIVNQYFLVILESAKLSLC
jgi:hypothetical protein